MYGQYGQYNSISGCQESATAVRECFNRTPYHYYPYKQLSSSFTRRCGYHKGHGIRILVEAQQKCRLSPATLRWHYFREMSTSSSFN